MLIRSWGSRGSISVSGKEYLRYGGDTTCVEVVSSEGDLIVIDAGTGIRRLGNRLLAEDRISEINVVFTHPHWDHLSGFPFFKPIYHEKAHISVKGPLTTQNYIKGVIEKTMTAPYFPVELEDIAANIEFHETEPEGFNVGPIKITTIPINHTNIGVGFKLEENGKSFVFLTDNELSSKHPSGLGFDEYVKFAEGADLLIHDAEYTPEDYREGWGHSTYTDAVRLAKEAGVKTLGLFHHNQDRDDDGIDAIEEASKELLSKEGSKTDCFAVSCETVIEL